MSYLEIGQLFDKQCVEKTIIFISQFIEHNGNLISYEKFVQDNTINITRIKYLRLIKEISPKLLNLIKSSLQYSRFMGVIHKLFIDGVDLHDKKGNNWHIIKTLICTNCIGPKSLALWKQMYPSIFPYNIWSYNTRQS